MRRLTNPAAHFPGRPGSDLTSYRGRKKHPSPSESDLEELEFQFRKMMPPKPSTPIPEEEDELALTFTSAQPKDTLGARDQNGLVRGSLPANLEGDKVEQHGHAKPRHTISSAKSTTSRIPRPIRRAQPPRPNTEFVHPAYPVAQADGSDLDELQWDDSAYQPGRNRRVDFSAPH